MSLNKSVAVSFVVIGLLLCTTPMMMDESDASVSERFTENYLLYAQFEKQSNPYDDWYFVDYLYYIDGLRKTGRWSSTGPIRRDTAYPVRTTVN